MISTSGALTQKSGEGPTESSSCVDADVADMNLSLCKIYAVVFIGLKTQTYWQELGCEVTATGAGARDWEMQENAGKLTIMLQTQAKEPIIRHTLITTKKCTVKTLKNSQIEQIILTQDM